MKAIVHYNYGSPDVLHCEDIAKPTPGDDDVLIRVRAASANPADWHFMRGEPYLLRLMTGLRKPKSTRLGTDLAGKVEAVGNNVTRFHPGDEVFGTCRGSFAEYVCAGENTLALKPTNITFEQAAATPLAALTALQGLRDKGRIQSGQMVVINGASGGVGTFAVQIAKSFGADVTGVCGTRNVELVRSIGADHVIDHTKRDFTRGTQHYDLVLDCVGDHSLAECKRVMSARGTYVGIGGPAGRWMVGPLARMLTAPLLSRLVSQNLVLLLASINKDDLIALKELIEAGKLTPVIDRRFTLTEVPDAIRYLEAGHACGKTVITVEHNNKP
jgi:NADPH:quinone reductase-like Zn-dependent oxidoreductase